MSLCSKNRFVSSANIMVFKKLEALGRSFIWTVKICKVSICKPLELINILESGIFHFDWKKANVFSAHK